MTCLQISGLVAITLVEIEVIFFQWVQWVSMTLVQPLNTITNRDPLLCEHWPVQA